MRSIEVNGQAMTRPASYGDAPLPKRQSPRGILPLSWTGRVIEVDYIGPDGAPAHAKGAYLDFCTSGPILNVEGRKTVVCFERICTVALVED